MNSESFKANKLFIIERFEMDFYSTKQVAEKLGVRPQTLTTAIWNNRLDPPQKSPSGSYLWTDWDIQRASWALLKRAYEPNQSGGKNEPEKN